jgi:hypothetical protein
LKKARNGQFDFIREWCKDNSEADIFYAKELGILTITTKGKATISSELLEGMKKNGFTLESISNEVGSDYIQESGVLKDYVDFANEHDVPFLISTVASFKDKKLPPLENDGTNDSDTVSDLQSKKSTESQSLEDADDDYDVIQSEVEQ